MQQVPKRTHKWRRIAVATSTRITPRRRSGKRKANRHVASSSRRQKRKIETSEDSRQWVLSPNDYSRYTDRFVIVSYNLLGVENALKHPDLYHQVALQNLDWNQRKKLILKELNVYKPSILCLQEVDRFDDLANLLAKDGYTGVYKGRTGEACDGCAVFWREDLFTILHQEDIEFQRFGLRDNVAQLCVLEVGRGHSNSFSDTEKSLVTETTQSRRLLVGNIHVLFNPNRGDIKLGQVRLFLKRAEALSKEWSSIPVVVAGDLNSMPQLDVLLHDRRKISGQIGYPLREGHFGFQAEATERSRSWKYFWSQEDVYLATGNRGCTYLEHNLKLHSAYPGVPGRSDTRDGQGEPLATSYHSKFMGTVDYIWHSEDLVPVGVVETLPLHTLKKTGGLPSEKWGSDHLALVCELAFADV